MTPEKKSRLGRGLGALIPSASASEQRHNSDITHERRDSGLQNIRIADILPNPYQPRREFRPDELAELQASLESNGLLQPVTVRPDGAGSYELVAGERRLRAATNLGWTEIAAVVRELDDQTMLVLALVENLQRANLNAVEEALGYRRLIDEFRLTQQQVADAVGKDRTTVTNLLRVLSLPEPIQRMVQSGQLSTGHARALLALPTGHSALDLANRALLESWSVRKLEQAVRESALGPSAAPASRTSGKQGGPAELQRSADPAVRRVEDDLRRYLQTDVHLQVAADTKGTLRIQFYSQDDLERVLDLILREHRKDF
jgi:ParB family chromosome partitioning protein